jgi:hypothetical protein
VVSQLAGAGGSKSCLTLRVFSTNDTILPAGWESVAEWLSRTVHSLRAFTDTLAFMNAITLSGNTSAKVKQISDIFGLSLNECVRIPRCATAVLALRRSPRLRSNRFLCAESRHSDLQAGQLLKAKLTDCCSRFESRTH